MTRTKAALLALLEEQLDLVDDLKEEIRTLKSEHMMEVMVHREVMSMHEQAEEVKVNGALADAYQVIAQAHIKNELGR